MARKRKGVPRHGWLVLDKPGTMTSTQAMAKVRWLLKGEKAGHGGTLDPIATGVLPIAFGEATKTVQYAMDGHKTYRFVMKFGEATDTDDRAGRVIATAPGRPTDEQIEAVLPRFTGMVSQIPPQYSAIKVDGERAYDLAREGEAVELAARIVRVDSFLLTGRPDEDHAEFEVECGKGTYMRSLARDLAVALGTLGHITVLRRLSVGRFNLENAVTLEELEQIIAEGARDPDDLLLPIETALDQIPAVDLTGEEAQRLRHGQGVLLLRRGDLARLEELRQDERDAGTALATERGRPVALVRLDGAELKPVRVLHV
ncbi:tRNA pseudouridine(55) synthase TruB [Niveispirillum irakense]|uniref:tRNA pseudouridine(55) synthase TruB n=1 Tax=Niveispirillum irakense TaxID=34011 RepID=UPI0004065ACC|nr:tRNA pseudouridine(55) synthase TruB [Niveispirillum irakense]